MVSYIEKIVGIYCRAKNQCLGFSVEIVDFRHVCSVRFSANNFLKLFQYNSNYSVYLQIMYIGRTMKFVTEYCLIRYFIGHIGSLKQN